MSLLMDQIYCMRSLSPKLRGRGSQIIRLDGRSKGKKAGVQPLFYNNYRES